MAESLDRDREWYFSIFAQSQVGLFRGDLEANRLLDANHRLAEIAGFDSVEDLIAHWDHAKHWMRPEEQPAAFQDLQKRGQVDRFEAQFRRKDGSTYWARLWARLLPDGKTFDGVVLDITAEKRALEELRLQKAFLEAQMEATPDGIAVLSDDRERVIVNSNFRRMWGFRDDWKPGYTELLNQILERAAGGRRVMEAVGFVREHRDQAYHDEMPLLDGRILEVNSTPIHDPPRGILGRVWAFRDISARQKAQEALLREKSLNESIVENAPACIVLLDRQFVVQKCNRAFLQTLEHRGLPHAGVVGRSYLDVLPGAEEHLRPVLEEVLRMGQPYNRRPGRLLLRHDGNVMETWWDVSIAPALDASGNVEGLLILCRDITDETRARDEHRQALEQSEHRYRTLIESQLEWVCRWLPDTTLTYVNGHYARFYGYTAAELLGTKWMDLVPEDRKAGARGVHADMVGNPRVKTYAHDDLDAEGRRVWQQWTDCPILDAQGRLVEIQSVGRDITELMGHQQALEESERRYRTLMETAADAIIIAEVDTGILVDCNRSASRLLGLPRERILGMHQSQLHPPELQDLSRQMFRREIEGTWRIHEGVVCRADGLRVAVTISASRFESQGKRYMQGIFHDVTEIRQKEEQFRQAQKMEAVGRLAGGIAHDFNNQLTVIKGYCDLLLRNEQTTHGLRMELEEIRKAARRAATLTSQLLLFSRQQVLRPEIVSLNEVLTTLANPLGTMIGEDIHLTVRTDPVLHSVRVDRARLEQAVMNLVVNARDAMPQGGHLTIEAANVLLDEAYVRRHVDAKAGSHVLLSVCDTGVGMDGETLKRIFEPFFTTKPVGQGTGLGLAMVYGFVQQSGGHIAVESDVAQGSVFRIYLPVAQGVPAVEANPPPGRVAPGHETVLVAEDSEPVRQLLLRVLAQCGYTVLEACGPTEAISMAENCPGPIDLLVSDVVMPGMSGPDLAAALRPVRKEMKVLFITGYAEEATTPHGFQPGANVLTKPFTAERLATAVRRALDGQTV